jgi:1,2-alpha-glucosylglycerol phosphorylase
VTVERLSDRLACTPDGWTLVERGWDAERAVAVGSNAMVGNGYLGYRGTSPELGAEDYVALVVSDTYDAVPGQWRELVTAPNPLLVSASIDGTPLTVVAADEVETTLDLRTGQFTERFVQSVGPVRAEVRSSRLASMEDLHLLAQRWTLRVDAPVEVEVLDGVDGVVWSLNGDHVGDMHLRRDGDQVLATVTTVERGTRLVVAQQDCTVGGESSAAQDLREPRRLLRRRRVGVGPHAPLVLETVASVYSSNDVTDPEAAARHEARRAAVAGFDGVAAGSTAAWAAIWERTDVVVDGPAIDQAALRFCAYHNRISTPAHTDHLAIGARGLSCQAYQGAAFWDQEVYNLPVYLFTEPDIARRLLVYRHRTLDGARRKAARHGYEGAFYAWMSGDTGDELCPDVFFTDVLTGRPIRNHFNVWQIHISPDIVTTIDRYVQVTGDTGYLVEHGAEIIVEVARFLRSFVRLDELRGTFHCIRLLGPDEWHENVDDNAFTNYQVHAALDVAVRAYGWLAHEHPEELAGLVARVGLEEAEVAAWARIRDHLFLPQPDPSSGLVEQFAGFFDLEDVTPDVLRGRLLHPQEYWGWPNGVAVRTQVSKQADVPVLLWLHRDRFDRERVAANYQYYAPRCAHGSTLSHPPFGFAAIRAGELDRALDHFRATATVDLLTTAPAVVGGTFIGGIHTAACGGAYQLAVQGFGGLDVAEGILRIDPSLPPGWQSLSYPVTYRGRLLRVTAAASHTTVDLIEGEPLTVVLAGEPVQVGALTTPGGPPPARS